MDDPVVSFTCQNCDDIITVDRNKIGYTIPCPHCSRDVPVPPFGIVPGMKIGGFIVEYRLGAGGMGEVWFATQEALQRKVALKILFPRFAENKEFVSRFMREAKVAGKLIHSNIATAHHAGTENNIYYLAIEYIEGVVLEDRLKIERMLPEDESLQIIHDIANALQYAWNEFKILHRDIKPGNIMVKLDGNAMLMDLGLSKSLLEDESMTLKGSLMGTPAYISPEQISGDKDIDFRADLYSLGATLFHLTTGRLPFQAETVMGIVKKHVNEPVPDCQKFNPKISPGCKLLIEKMMTKERKNRFVSYENFISELELVQAGGIPNARSVFANFSKTYAICAGLILIVISLLATIVLSPKSEKEITKPKKIPKQLVINQEEKQNSKEKSVVTSQEKLISQEKQMKEMWDYAVEYAEKNSNAFYESVNKFKKIADLFPNTKYRLMAEDEIEKLQNAQKDAIAEIILALKEKTAALIKNNKFDKALLLLNGYDKEFKKETADERQKIIEHVESQKKEFIDNQLKTEKENRVNLENSKEDFLNETTLLLLKGKYKTALKFYTESPVKGHFKVLQSPLDDLAHINEKLEDALKNNIEKKVEIKSQDRMVEATIKNVKNGKLYISVTQGPVTSKRTISIKKLPAKEKKRLLKDVINEKALMIYEIRNSVRTEQYDIAEQQAENTGVLSDAIMTYISKLEKKKAKTTERVKTVKKPKYDSNKSEKLFKTLKSRIGTSDRDTEKLVKIIEDLHEKLDDKNLKNVHHLGMDTLNKARSILSGQKHFAFGEYVREEIEKKGFQLPPPRPPPGEQGNGDGPPRDRPQR